MEESRHLQLPALTSVLDQPLSLSLPPPYTISGVRTPESTLSIRGLSILRLLLDSSFVTSILLRLCPSSISRRLAVLLPGLLGVSRTRFFSYRRSRMAMRGTARRRKTMATTMPIIAPGEKPSLWVLALGMLAGGASGMRVEKTGGVGVDVGAIAEFVCSGLVGRRVLGGKKTGTSFERGCK